CAFSSRSTRARVSACTSGLRRNTSDTVARETPQPLAMSVTVTRLRLGLEGFKRRFPRMSREWIDPIVHDRARIDMQQCNISLRSGARGRRPCRRVRAPALGIRRVAEAERERAAIADPRPVQPGLRMLGAIDLDALDVTRLPAAASARRVDAQRPAAQVQFDMREARRVQ